MKIFLCVVVLAASVAVGSVMSEKFRRKERFYFDLLTFCTSFRVNLGYKRATVAEVLRQNAYGKDFSEYAQSALSEEERGDFGDAEKVPDALQNLFKNPSGGTLKAPQSQAGAGVFGNISGNKNPTETARPEQPQTSGVSGAKNRKKLLKNLMVSEQDLIYIENFFMALGKNDAESQLKEMEFFSKYFEKKLAEAQENAKLKSPMAMKLSVLSGFLLCIMII